MEHISGVFRGHEKDGTLDEDDGCWGSRGLSCSNLLVSSVVVTAGRAVPCLDRLSILPGFVMHKFREILGVRRFSLQGLGAFGLGAS